MTFPASIRAQIFGVAGQRTTARDFGSFFWIVHRDQLRTPVCAGSRRGFASAGDGTSRPANKERKEIACYLSTLTDPWKNLAIEEWLFRQTPPHLYVLLLWRNSKCVVLGKNQNPWKEINMLAVAQDGVPLVRRRSGGGTVYHDLGNTNYSLMVPRTEFSRSHGATMVARALHNLDIPARTNERFDVVVDVNGHPKKISGSAYKIVSQRAYHHGTMLINSDLADLRKYLKIPPKKIVSKGIGSVPSPVTSIGSISFTASHQAFCHQVRNEFLKEHGYFELVRPDEEYDDSSRGYASWNVIDDPTLNSMPGVDGYVKETKEWEWTYGLTPQFLHELSTDLDIGPVTLTLHSTEGVITQCEVSECPESLRSLVGSFTQSCQGLRYGYSDIRMAFDRVVSDFSLKAVRDDNGIGRWEGELASLGQFKKLRD
ncbi:Lipoyltransferase and lipoate-protein ligase, partial [Gonapodya prolifera JEL478]